MSVDRTVHDPAVPDPATILLVEDDDQVRDFIRNLLTADGHKVLHAKDGAAGFEAALRHEGKIHLLLADMLLPEMSGYDLAVKLRERSPQLKILFITGYVEGDIVQRCLSELNADFLDKPFQPTTLRQTVRRILSPANAA